MNAIFPILTIASAIALAVVSPESFLSSLTAGAEKAVSLAVTLSAVYALWLGIFEMVEKTDLMKKIARLIARPIEIVFGKTDETSQKLISANVAANLLGLGGAATPLGVAAVSSLDKSGNRYAVTMLLVVASTSLQLLPTSVISLRASLGSAAPSSIVFPALVSTLVSSVCGILLTKIFIKK